MSIDYEFQFEDGHPSLIYTVDPDDPEKGSTRSEAQAEWTALKNSQCSNCPLDSQKYKRCPAAIDMQRVVEDFGTLPAIQKVNIIVTTPERTYKKKTGIEEGLRSLMGLIMANSTCPILANLKPMTYTHLPFASQTEFILRSTGNYLVRQYYLTQVGKEPDWKLKGLIDLNQELRLVNQAMWQRIHEACKQDSNLKALLSFFTMSSSVSYSLEAQLSKIKKAFLSEKEINPYGKP